MIATKVSERLSLVICLTLKDDFKLATEKKNMNFKQYLVYTFRIRKELSFVIATGWIVIVTSQSVCEAIFKPQDRDVVCLALN